jgi:subtilisin family serine protease
MAPSYEVQQAWNLGWTGKGVNILIDDQIGKSDYAGLISHPLEVMLSAQRIAIASTYYGMPFNDPNNTIVNLDGSIAKPSKLTKIGVVNISVGASVAELIGAKTSADNSLTNAQLLSRRSMAEHSAYIVENPRNYLNSANFSGSFALNDAVISKAAGNSSIDAQYEPMNYWFSKDTSIVSRLLIVGAIDQRDLSISNAHMDSSSNFAGSDPTIQSRFILASRTYDSFYGTAWDGNPLTSGMGTSFAAPRIAGYAALVRQKFPNLTGANTADILLSTATYNGLACNPTCDKAIYGQGLASISRALAPVGYLR